MLNGIGICHTIDTPTILLWNSKLDLSLPFDIKDHRIISYDFEKSEEARSSLKHQIESAEKGLESYNPIDKTFKSQIHSVLFTNTLEILEKMITLYQNAQSIAKSTEHDDEKNLKQ